MNKTQPMKSLNYIVKLTFVLGIISVLSACSKDEPYHYIPDPEPEPTPEEEPTYNPVKTGLPVLYIQTPNKKKIESKEEWIEGATYVLFSADGEKLLEGKTSIKGRGNTTWYYPKKPYAIKLDEKVKVLGMAKEKRFDLIANWMDRTLMRNAVAYAVAAKCSGLAWTPTGKFVEFYLNGSHQGNYFLCEHIKVSKNRVNIAEVDEKVTKTDSITGGFIMELDAYYDEQYKFHSAKFRLPYMFKDPDVVNDKQIAFMKNYIEKFETSLYDQTKLANHEYADYIDLESFVDYWFVYELCFNEELKHPKSCYVYKDIKGKLTAGPVWDFDWGTFLDQSIWAAKDRTGFYYPYLFKDKEFVNLVKSRWTTLKPEFEKISKFIDETKESIAKSEGINNSLWPINNKDVVNGDEKDSFETAVKKLKSNYEKRIVWLDGEINKL